MQALNNSVMELTILSDRGNIFSDEGTKYVIPLYQRAFAWEEKEITQLIEDINDFEEESYYLGSLIVSKNGGSLEIIDGQQRLTAMFLLLNSLNIEVGNTLTFACREKSNYTLENINNLLLDKSIEPSLQRGKRITDGIVNGRGFDREKFISKLKRVKLFVIEVPKNTDLNRYFEIMNTRGEQLEQHDILKAVLMSALSGGESKRRFAKIWDACSDMTGYVQMHFDTAARMEVFGENWDVLKSDLREYLSSVAGEKNDSGQTSIKDIIKHDFIADCADSAAGADGHIRFESVITFPFFLLHTLKVLVAEKNIRHIQEGQTLVYELLDDKKLNDAFSRVIAYGVSAGGLIAERKEEFSLDFIECLLKCRFLFDKCIIKREYLNDNSDGEWSLKELKVSGQQSNKKPFYTNTYFGKKNEWKKTFEPRHRINLMLQSCLRVSYTSPKIMHWITELLKWLYDERNLSAPDEFEARTESAIKSAVKSDYLEPAKDGSGVPQYDWGVNTPHIVFNYLDYLLWKDQYFRSEFRNLKDQNFIFEFRNSVEHWYPRHPSEGTFEKWTHEDGVDGFGNLCLIQRSVNSKFSNMSPEAKKSTFGEMISKGSLKLREMANITQTSRRWKETVCREHEKAMIERLTNACMSK